jgi:hypothetical protein
MSQLLSLGESFGMPHEQEPDKARRAKTEMALVYFLWRFGEPI